LIAVRVLIADADPVRLRGRFTPVADRAAHRSRRHDLSAPLCHMPAQTVDLTARTLDEIK